MKKREFLEWIVEYENIVFGEYQTTKSLKDKKKWRVSFLRGYWDSLFYIKCSLIVTKDNYYLSALKKKEIIAFLRNAKERAWRNMCVLTEEDGIKFAGSCYLTGQYEAIEDVYNKLTKGGEKK